jgi:uncharacterized membrane protein YkoI
MKKTYFSLLQALTLVTLLSFNGPLHAAPEAIDKQQAVSIAQQTYPGRVLSVKLKDGVYRVKTLSEDGEVRVILIDAKNGKVITGS